MGKKAYILLAFMLYFMAACGSGQSNSAMVDGGGHETFSLDVDPPVIDLGTIRADDGPVPCTFICANTGAQVARMAFVTTSCSCVTVSFPQDDLQPGEFAQIDAVFNPAGLGGEVTRYVTVWETGEKMSAVVEIKAVIIPTERPLEGRLLCGRADASAGSVDFGYVPAGTTATLVETLTNVSDSRLELSVDVKGCSRLHVQCPEIVDPGEMAELVLLYSMPSDLDSLGVCNNMVEVSSGDCLFQLPVKSICVAKQTGEDGSLPSMWTTSSPVEISKGFFEIGNNGKGPLEIYKIETDNGVELKVPGRRIGYGKAKKVRIPDVATSFTARIYTNDPARPAREIRFNY